MLFIRLPRLLSLGPCIAFEDFELKYHLSLIVYLTRTVEITHKPVWRPQGNINRLQVFFAATPST